MTSERPLEVLLCLRGKAAMRGRHIGRARLMRDPTDLMKIEAGDVAVLRTASPAAGPILGVAGAVITEEGGILSSLATLARERDVPCIVGVSRATRAILDGDQVVVDADAGTVTVVTAARCA
jgi:pyruvate,water dikinase